jgi:hypothetical protein
MGNAFSKLRQVFRTIGILLLIEVSVVCWAYEGTKQLKSKSQFRTTDDLVDTIIMSHERSRIRIFFEVSKKMAFMVGDLSIGCVNLQPLNFFELKALFISAYQRNVFYVYASHSVP